jgi:hypothetical protein
MSHHPESSADGVLERTTDGGVIRVERHLQYAIRDVWDAITNPARLRTGGCRPTPTSPSTPGRARECRQKLDQGWILNSHKANDKE